MCAYPCVFVGAYVGACGRVLARARVRVCVCVCACVCVGACLCVCVCICFFSVRVYMLECVRPLDDVGAGVMCCVCLMRMCMCMFT